MPRGQSGGTGRPAREKSWAGMACHRVRSHKELPPEQAAKKNRFRGDPENPQHLMEGLVCNDTTRNDAALCRLTPLARLDPRAPANITKPPGESYQWVWRG